MTVGYARLLEIRGHIQLVGTYLKWIRGWLVEERPGLEIAILRRRHEGPTDPMTDTALRQLTLRHNHAIVIWEFSRCKNIQVTS